MKLVYNVKDKPKFGQLLIFAFQQLLAILAATIAVPAIIGNGMSQSAALFGAGGAARAVIWGLAKEGAERITVGVRDEMKARAALADLGDRLTLDALLRELRNAAARAFLWLWRGSAPRKSQPSSDSTSASTTAPEFRRAASKHAK